MSRQNRSSLALSDTTYYSFNDIELVEPPEPTSDSDRYGQEMQQDPKHKQDRDRFEASKMQRQDSGYESYGPSSPRNSISNGSRPSVTVTRQNSTTTSPAATCVRSARPSTRRSTRSYNTYSGNQAPYKVRSQVQSQPIGYVQFPAPDLVELAEPTPSEAALTAAQLPQTTHYWTSDSTRRLEYAAMDAAGRGVKGWMRKHLVPDCLVPQDSKHVSFDDDTGSVRRYRLQLEDDRGEKRHQMRQPTRRKSWRFWRE